MKVAILAGGVGTRLVEETEVKPKPMVEIGGRPILWHIMRHYAHYGFKEFVIALGYKGEVIKKYMVDYSSLNSNLTVKLEHRPGGYSWRLQAGLDRGSGRHRHGDADRRAHQAPAAVPGQRDLHADLGRRRLRCEPLRPAGVPPKHGKLATLTAVRPPARFGHLVFDGDQVAQFSEKPQTGEGWINGAFFVLEPGVFDYIDGDDTQWEKEPMERLAADGQLMAYRHTSFWQCMDTLRDKKLLEELWHYWQSTLENLGGLICAFW